MNTVDIIILACFLPALIHGLRKGFIAQGIALISIFVGAWLAFHFAGMVSEWLAQHLTGVSQSVLYIISFVLVAAVVIFLLAIVGRALRGIIKFAMLGWVDRLLGAILGMLAAAMIISIALILFNWLNDVTAIVKPEILEGSKIFTPLKDLGYDIFPYLKGFIAGR